MFRCWKRAERCSQNSSLGSPHPWKDSQGGSKTSLSLIIFLSRCCTLCLLNFCKKCDLFIIIIKSSWSMGSDHESSGAGASHLWGDPVCGRPAWWGDVMIIMMTITIVMKAIIVRMTTMIMRDDNVYLWWSLLIFTVLLVFWWFAQNLWCWWFDQNLWCWWFEGLLRFWKSSAALIISTDSNLHLHHLWCWLSVMLIICDVD